MKQMISDLLDAISPYEFSDCDTEELIVRARDALESGTFDCLIERPGSKPPDSSRKVLVQHSGGHAIGFYLASRDEWLVNHGGGRLKTVLVWWELQQGGQNENA